MTSGSNLRRYAQGVAALQEIPYAGSTLPTDHHVSAVRCGREQAQGREGVGGSGAAAPLLPIYFPRPGQIVNFMNMLTFAIDAPKDGALI